MYSTTTSATDTSAGSQKTILGAVHRMWRVLLVVFCYWLLQWAGADLASAFYRSVVVCHSPVRVAGKCPTGSVESLDGECSAVPKSSRDWSGSAHCADKDYVVSRGIAVQGKVTSLGYLGMIFSQVFVGAAMLDTLGRKPVMLMGMASSTVMCGVLWFSCHVASEYVMSVIVIGALICKLSDSFLAASTASIADLARGDSRWQSLGFSASNVLRSLGIVLAFAAGFPVLSLYLEDYTMVWGFMLILGCAATTISAVVLRETIAGGMAVRASAASVLAGPGPSTARPPDHLESGGGGKNPPLEPGVDHAVDLSQGQTGTCPSLCSQESGNAFRGVWNDPFLCGCMVLWFIGISATYGTLSIIAGFGLEVTKLRQQVVSLSGVVQPVAVAIGSLVAPELLDRMGCMGTYLFGLLVLICGLVIFGASAYFHGQSIFCFWLGVFTCGIGFGLIEPSFCKIVSLRAQRQNSGKAFSVKMFMETMGMACGTYVWSNHLFADMGSGTWRAGMGMFASAGLLLGVFGGAAFLHRMHSD